VAVGAVTEKAVARASDAGKAQIAGDFEEAGKVGRPTLRPGSELVGAADRGDLFEPVAEHGGAQEGAELAQDGEQANLLGRGDGARRAAGLQRQAVRPLAGEIAHQAQQVGPRRQHLALRFADRGRRGRSRA
jgi:hypothetical protein